jgi:hypothetical protein
MMLPIRGVFNKQESDIKEQKNKDGRILAVISDLNVFLSLFVDKTYQS